jgi:C4-dicarboxylate transporter DctQ subunit
LVKISKVYDLLIDTFALLAVCLLIFQMLGIVAQVILRYAFNIPISWMIEICEYSLLWVAFLSAAWLQRKNGHIKVELLVNMLKPELRSIVGTVTALISAVVFLIITWFSMRTTYNMFQMDYYIHSWLEPLKWPILIIIPIGSLLFSIEFIRTALKPLRQR